MQLTFVYIKIAILTLKAFYTFTFETAITEIDARAVIVARFCRTMIHNQCAIGISVALAAFAFVISDTINANLVIWTHHVYAIIDIHVAHLALKAM